MASARDLVRSLRREADRPFPWATRRLQSGSVFDRLHDSILTGLQGERLPLLTISDADVRWMRCLFKSLACRAGELILAKPANRSLKDFAEEALQAGMWNAIRQQLPMTLPNETSSSDNEPIRIAYGVPDVADPIDDSPMLIISDEGTKNSMDVDCKPGEPDVKELSRSASHRSIPPGNIPCEMGHVRSKELTTGLCAIDLKIALNRRLDLQIYQIESQLTKQMRAVLSNRQFDHEINHIEAQVKSGRNSMKFVTRIKRRIRQIKADIDKLTKSVAEVDEIERLIEVKRANVQSIAESSTDYSSDESVSVDESVEVQLEGFVEAPSSAPTVQLSKHLDKTIDEIFNSIESDALHDPDEQLSPEKVHSAAVPARATRDDKDDDLFAVDYELDDEELHALSAQASLEGSPTQNHPATTLNENQAPTSMKSAPPVPGFCEQVPGLPSYGSYFNDVDDDDDDFDCGYKRRLSESVGKFLLSKQTKVDAEVEGAAKREEGAPRLDDVDKMLFLNISDGENDGDELIKAFDVPPTAPSLNLQDQRQTNIDLSIIPGIHPSIIPGLHPSIFPGIQQFEEFVPPPFVLRPTLPPSHQTEQVPPKRRFSTPLPTTTKTTGTSTKKKRRKDLPRAIDHLRRKITPTAFASSKTNPTRSKKRRCDDQIQSPRASKTQRSENNLPQLDGSDAIFGTCVPSEYRDVVAIAQLTDPPCPSYTPHKASVVQTEQKVLSPFRPRRRPSESVSSASSSSNRVAFNEFDQELTEEFGLPDGDESEESSDIELSDTSESKQNDPVDIANSIISIDSSSDECDVSDFENPSVNAIPPASSPLIGDDCWEAQCILKMKQVKGRKMYLIKWAGSQPDGQPWENSWEPTKNLSAALLRDFNERQENQARKAASTKKRAPRQRSLTVTLHTDNRRQTM